MTHDFEVRRERDDAAGVEIVAVRGEIDVFTAPEVKKVAAEALETSPRLVVDLSETTFMDSTALGVLIGLVKRARPAGGDVVLVNTDPGIARTLEITGLNEILRVVDGREPAVAALAS